MPTIEDGKAQDAVVINPHYNPTASIHQDGTPEDPQPHEYLKMILTAKVYEVAKQTELTPASLLSQKVGRPIFLKREDLQSVHSFKLRGAYNKLSALTPEERARGVIACSAGNHAQGLALAASKLGISAKIVMPSGTSEIKWSAVARLGGEVLLHGIDLFEAKQEALKLAKLENRVFVHPFDQPEIIAGQGTVGMEVLRQFDAAGSGVPLGAIFVPIGGGGLLSGIAAYVKALYPHIKVIGVNCVDSDAMRQALMADKPVLLPTVNGFSDGTAVSEIGKHCYKIARLMMDELVLVTTDEICAAIKDVFLDTRSVLEPAGAMSIAGMKKWCALRASVPGVIAENAAMVSVISGANMNFDRCRFVAERAEIGEAREALIAVRMTDQPGQLFAMYECIAPRPVVHIAYRFRGHRGMGQNSPLVDHHASIIIGFAVQNRAADLADVFGKMKKIGIDAIDLSNNEMGKTHLLHLCGGRADIDHERIIHFTFPERPMALHHFLTHLTKIPADGPFNLTLLSYRNSGGDIGRVLVGIEVPPERAATFDGFLDNVGFTWKDETHNEVHRWFLKAKLGEEME